jgi:hypothetical protein
MPTGLPHIQDGQLSADVFAATCYSWSAGPLTVQCCVDLSVPNVTVTVTLAGVTIGRAVLDPQHTSATIGGSVAGFKAEVTLTVDFTAATLTISAEVCAPFVGCKDYSTTIHF